MMKCSVFEQGESDERKQSSRTSFDENNALPPLVKTSNEIELSAI